MRPKSTRRHRHPRRPPLSEALILSWIDAHRRLTGEWPTADSAWVIGTVAEKWINLDTALRQGRRSLDPGSSLARLLTEHRGVRNPKVPPRLRVVEIVRWAKAHRRRTGRLPNADSGPIAEASGETWLAVNQALVRGGRGLPGGKSLAQLLTAECGYRNIHDLPPLTIGQILRWADAHQRRTGAWPTRNSGAIAGTRGETWNGVASAMHRRRRGLESGITLARLLHEKRGVAYPA